MRKMISKQINCTAIFPKTSQACKSEKRDKDVQKYISTRHEAYWIMWMILRAYCMLCKVKTNANKFEIQFM